MKFHKVLQKLLVGTNTLIW